MSRYIDVNEFYDKMYEWVRMHGGIIRNEMQAILKAVPSIDIVRCMECRKSHIDGKTTHYLWCTEWGRSTDTFGYCERGEREGE